MSWSKGINCALQACSLLVGLIPYWKKRPSGGEAELFPASSFWAGRNDFDSTYCACLHGTSFCTEMSVSQKLEISYDLESWLDGTVELTHGSQRKVYEYQVWGTLTAGHRRNKQVRKMLIWTSFNRDCVLINMVLFPKTVFFKLTWYAAFPKPQNPLYGPSLWTDVSWNTLWKMVI